MPATVRYNLLRLMMVVVVGAVCYVLGARGLALIMLAFFISLPLSFLLLARWRKEMIDEFASGKAQRINPVRAVNERIDSAERSEDAILDQLAESDAANAKREDAPPTGEGTPGSR
jgi:hypothetical protein